MDPRPICILGGTGFVGQALTRRLVAAGRRVRVLTRRRERHRELLVLPTAELVEVDVHNPVALREALSGAGAAVNLVGILNERGRDGRGFERAHVELPARLVQACRDAGITRLLHMSALHAAPDGPSFYLRSKGQGERLLHAAEDLQVTSFRPSVIFGPGDSFTNRFARLLRLTPWVFPLACPQARFQPVYVNDVADVFATALDRYQTFGQRYNLCGPRVYRLDELLAYIGELIGARRRIIGLGDTLSRLQAAVLDRLPGKPFSRDNYLSLTVDSVCSQGFPGEFGVVPASLEQIAPIYLRDRSQFDESVC